MQWIPALGFGNGKNGSPAVSGTINTYAACTGTITQTSLTTTLAATAGDVIVIYQSVGTGAGQWELNYVLADAGSTLSLLYPLTYSYASGAQVIIVPQYQGGTLNGVVTCQAWDGSTGGVIALMSSGALNITGSLSTNGCGFRGSTNPGTADTPVVTRTGGQGEGYSGTFNTKSVSNAGNGGGGGGADPDTVPGSILGGGGGGAGGGYASSGSNGNASNEYPTNGGSGGTAGAAAGLASLTSLFMGGGGGAGASDNDSGVGPGAYGGNGGGIIMIFAPFIDATSATSLSCTGSNGLTVANSVSGGAGSWAGGGGGGAGGAILFKTQIATLDTNKATAAAGTGGNGRRFNTSDWQAAGGNGSVGRIHIDYSVSYTGTTSPTIDATLDSTVRLTSGGSFLTNFL